MQHRIDNCRCDRFRTLVVAAAILASGPAIATATKPDPLLSATPQTACQAGADYVPGVDADGDAVVPADVGAAKVAGAAQVVMPLPGRHRGAVVLDGAKLDPLVNPAPCKN